MNLTYLTLPDCDLILNQRASAFYETHSDLIFPVTSNFPGFFILYMQLILRGLSDLALVGSELHLFIVLGLRVWLLEGHRISVLEDLARVVLARRGEVGKSVTIWLLVLLVGVVHVGLRRVVSERHLILEVHSSVLHWVKAVILLLCISIHILLLGVEDTIHLLLMVSSRIFACLGRNDLNVTMAGQEFHVRRTVEKNFSRDRW